MTREEAIKELRSFIGQLTEGCQEAIKVLIPELKESDDERIRKAILEFFKLQDDNTTYSFIPKKSILAWLEKQKDLAAIPDELVKNYKLFCEQGGRESALLINAINGFNKQKEQKPITESKRLAHEVIEYLIRCGYSPVLKDDPKKTHFRIDIPRHEDDFWLSEEYKHCRNVLGEYYIEGHYACDTYTLYIWRVKKEQKPYEPKNWPADKNNLTQEQKPVEWSEEDEKMLNELITIIDGGIVTSRTYLSESKYVSWLKSLKDRGNFPKSNTNSPSEWSEDDERMLNVAIKSCEQTTEDYPNDKVRFNDCIAWLKSLRPQYHGDVTMTEAYKMGLEAGKASSWKPSDEQMRALLRAEGVVRVHDTKELAAAIAQLYEDLKKL